MYETTPVRVLLEQGPCLAIWKPAGLLTQAPPGIDSLESRIKAWLKHREQKPGNVYLGVPHRLDRPVSGAMVFARHARAARRLAEQFESRVVAKRYWACVEGELAEPTGTWRDHMRKIPNVAQAELASPEHPEAREAVLHYRVLGQSPLGAWLEIELETGRMHQIRLQAGSRGHAVVGDAMYGATSTFGPECEDERLRPIALHGRMLEFRHPMTHEPISITAPLPIAWRQLGLSLDDSEFVAEPS